MFNRLRHSGRLTWASSGVLLLVVVLSSMRPAGPGSSGQVVAAPQRAGQQLDPQAIQLEKRLADEVQPLLQKYCYECHGNGKKKGGVALDTPGDIQSIMDMADDWETVVEVMNTGLMPPPKKPQPNAQELFAINQWVEKAAAYHPPDAKPDPGWYTIHRLNRNEYRNTMRDLLGIDPTEHDLAADLPSDNTGYGFDNIADVLSMSPLQLEKFLDAAEQAVELAFGPEIDLEPKPVGGLKITKGLGRPLPGGGQQLSTNGIMAGEYAFAYDGTYEISVRALGTRAERVGPRMEIQVAGQTLETVDVKARLGEEAQRFTLRVELEKGRHDVGVAFVNDRMVTVNGKRQDRNLRVESIEVVGPLIDHNNNPVYQDVFFMTPTADDKGKRLPGVKTNRRITESQAARKVLERFATRAFRRHASSADTAALMRVYTQARKQGEGYEPAVKLALTAALVSPNFLYRPIANPKPDEPDHIYELSDYELASRLSYFLWSSMPDDRLLKLAQQNKLSDPKELGRQTRRMLMDERADAFVENFAGQWLLLRKLDGVAVDPQRYPGFNDTLRDAMRTEAELFFADVLRKDRSVLAFLDSEHTFVNAELAEHYGMAGVKGEQFRVVPLPARSPRGGVLTMAATLTVTSEATRTSPVRRGDYVLKQLMGTAPPPPPPDVPPLEQAGEKLGDDATLREQLAAHVADPNCAVCHKRLDPIGLAMENFDAIGAWRDSEQGKPIDASGDLPGGISFNGPTELKNVMLDQKDQFVENLSRKMLTYAVGRGTEPFDRPTIQKISQSVIADDYRMQSLIEAVVLSDAFRKARARGEK